MKTIYNFNYFGSQRESTQVSGHLTVHISGKEFAIVKLNDYSGLNCVGNEIYIKIDDSVIRQVHDAIIRKYGRCTIDLNEYTNESKKEGLLYYPIHEHRISANISYGDNVIDIRTNESFKVDHTHNVKYINRNMFFKLVDRPQFHPEPASKKDVLSVFEGINVFSDWSIVDTIPKGSTLMNHCIVNGTECKVYSGDMYNYIVFDNIIYSKRSIVYATSLEVVDILTKKIYCKYKDGCPYDYVLSDVKSLYKSYRPIQMDVDTSYHYNNVLTEYPH